MDTEIGSIADLLNKTEADKTPLQKQLDRLTVVIAGLAGVAFVAMILLGLANDQDFDEVFLAGVALAISAIPTGLPAVVTTLYSMGTQGAGLAERHRQAPALGRDARVGLGDLLGQDGHADPQQDDGPGARRARSEPLQHQRRGLRDRGTDPPRGRGDDRPHRRPAADGAVRRRPPGRRRADRRPDRGRAHRARRQGRHRPRRRPRALPPRRRGAVRLRLQVHGHVPPDDRPPRQGRRPLLRQGRTRRAARPRRLVLDARRDLDADRRRAPATRQRRERPHGRQGRTGHGGRPPRLRPGDVPTGRAAPRRHPRPDAAGDGRHRRPTPGRGEGGDRAVPPRRHRGAHDHRRPRRDRGRHRSASSASPARR